ncbi:MAG: bacteriohemerythrin [Pseudomonadota bacterium]
MFKTLISFTMALVFVSGIVAAILTFISLGFTSPVPWVLIIGVVAIPFIYKKYIRANTLAWDPSYSVGVTALDDDHKHLIHLINQLDSAANYYTGSEFEEKALQEVVDYTKYHFDREEQLMKDNGYPDYDNHHKTHLKMIEKVNQVVEDYKKNPDYAINDTVKFLRDWLINHICKTDREYMDFFKSKGIS